PVLGEKEPEVGQAVPRGALSKEAARWVSKPAEHRRDGVHMNVEWILLPAVGALIGWFTNFIAIRMLFRPRKPVRLFGRFVLQGVLPRRREEFARVVGETVERDLLPVDELVDSLDLAGYQNQVIDAVIGHVGRRVDQNLPALLPSNVRRMISNYARQAVGNEVALVAEEMISRIKEQVRRDVKLAELVRQKMSQLDTERLESIVVRVAATELRAIEVLGAVLGLTIGLVQAALLALWCSRTRHNVFEKRRQSWRRSFLASRVPTPSGKVWWAAS